MLYALIVQRIRYGLAEAVARVRDAQTFAKRAKIPVRAYTQFTQTFINIDYQLLKMPPERLTESDINRLRGVVGLGATKSPESQNTAVQKQEEKIMPTPLNMPPVSAPVNNLIEPKEHPKPKTQVETELFVKIDEHTEVAKELIEAKRDIKSIAETISLLGKAEKLKAEAIERLDSHLDTLDAKLIDVESKLTAPEGLEIPTEGIDLGPASDVSDLHRTLERLKDELEDVE